MILSFEVRKKSCCFFVMSSPFPGCGAAGGGWYRRVCAAELQPPSQTARRPPAAETDWVMGGQREPERPHPPCANTPVKALSAELGCSKGGCVIWGSSSRRVRMGDVRCGRQDWELAGEKLANRKFVLKIVFNPRWNQYVLQTKYCKWKSWYQSLGSWPNFHISVQLGFDWIQNPDSRGFLLFFPQHSSHISIMICQFSPPLSGAESQKHARRDFGDHKQFLIENSPKSS